jgi:hypothetical protein
MGDLVLKRGERKGMTGQYVEGERAFCISVCP